MKKLRITSLTGESIMQVFKGEAEAIEFLKTQDLNQLGVGMGVNGKTLKDGFLCGPWHVSGYLYDKETLAFPIGERFKINISWRNKEDAEAQIRRIREALE